jgi:hypothetical protein
MTKPPSVMRQVGIIRRQPVRFGFPAGPASGVPGSPSASACGWFGAQPGFGCCG